MPEGNNQNRLTAPKDRLKVFISYSRNDSRFAAELVAGLEYDGGFEVFIDRHSIHEGEEWKERLRGLIAEADTVVVILSRNWLNSAVAAWELEEAFRNSKRVIPVQESPLGDLTPPTRLAAINYVRFDQEPGLPPKLFMEGMSSLRRALNTDLAWVREHSRLLARASEWETAGRVENRMLAGNDIKAAKEWVSRRPKSAPTITELQRDFIAASEQAEATLLSKERKRAETLQKAVTRTRAALAVALVLALIAAAAGHIARNKEQEAKASESLATRERDRVLTVQSQHLADLASGQLAAHDSATAMILALAGLPDNEGADRPYVASEESRLWESYFSNHERLVFGHEGTVLCVAQSPEGGRLATGTSEGFVRVWDIKSGLRLMEFKHEGPVNGVTFSPDGKRILSASADNTLRIWDAAANHEIVRVGVQDAVLSVAVSRDTGRILTGNRDRVARVWDSSGNGSPLAQLTGHAGPVYAVAFSDDGTLALTGSSDGVKVWDVANAKEIVFRSDRERAVPIASVAFSPDARLAAAGSFNDGAFVWSPHTGETAARFKRHTKRVSGIAFLAGHDAIASTSDDGTVRIWNAASGDELETFAGYLEGATSLAASRDGSLVAAGSRDGTARVWTIFSKNRGVPLAGHSKRVTGVALDGGGTRAVTGSGDGKAIVWDANSQKQLSVLDTGPSEVSSVAMSYDGALVAAGSADGKVHLWRSDQDRPSFEIDSMAGAVNSIALNAAGTLLATGSEDRKARLWNASSGELQKTLGPLADQVRSLAFTPAGDVLVTGAASTARVWDTATGTQLARPLVHHAPVLAVAVSPKGDLVAAGGRDQDVLVWQFPGIRLKWTLSGHSGAVKGLVFSDDGTKLAAASDDGTIRIWLSSTGEQVGVIQSAGHDITSFAMASHGGVLATASSDSRAYITPFFPNRESLIENAKKDAPRCLTKDQMIRFHLGLEPLRWCLTGAGLEHERDTRKWRAKWPNQDIAPE
jgi:WD40 repeat protein